MGPVVKQLSLHFYILMISIISWGLCCAFEHFDNKDYQFWRLCRALLHFDNDYAVDLYSLIISSISLGDDVDWDQRSIHYFEETFTLYSHTWLLKGKNLQINYTLLSARLKTYNLVGTCQSSKMAFSRNSLCIFTVESLFTVFI